MPNRREVSKQAIGPQLDATGQPGKRAGAGDPNAENEKLRKRYKVWRREHGAGLMKTRGFIICGDEAREVLQGFGPGASEPLRELGGPMLALPSFLTNPSISPISPKNST